MFTWLVLIGIVVIILVLALRPPKRSETPRYPSAVDDERDDPTSFWDSP